jgi:dTMP kinase
MKGKFISFEGVDGAGKSTQIQMASDYLKSRGIEHIVTREPGGSPLAEQLRAMVIQEKMPIETEVMIMWTARVDHVETVIKPHLERGIWVISDRFFDSSYAYQCGGRGFPVDRMKELQRWTLRGFAPDLTIMLDMEIGESYRRMEDRVAKGERVKLDKFEMEPGSFFDKVRWMLQDLCDWQENMNRIRLVDAAQTIGDVARDIQSHFKALMLGGSQVGNFGDSSATQLQRQIAKVPLPDFRMDTEK